jgi:hypothetical protein
MLMKGTRYNKKMRVKQRKRKEKGAYIYILESMQKQNKEACCKQEKKLELVQM